jgi:hypothetical protein
VQPKTIAIEENVFDSLDSLSHLIASLVPLRAVSDGSNFCLDLSRLGQLGPDGATFLSGSVLEARSRGVSVSVVWPSLGPLLAFTQFSGMQHLLDGVGLPNLRDPVNVTVPLRQFTQSRHTDVDPIIELMARFVDVSEKLRDSLAIAVNETVQNIVDHSSSPVGGLGCARYVTKPLRGTVTIISGNTAVEAVGESGLRYSDVPVPFRGTAVCFTLPPG